MDPLPIQLFNCVIQRRNIDCHSTRIQTLLLHGCSIAGDNALHPVYIDFREMNHLNTVK